MITAKPVIQNLLNRLIDYAGLFPPAELDMASTVQNYDSYLKCDDAWMLGRLIVPVGRLDEFEREAGELLPRGEHDDPWAISAITRPAGSDDFSRDIDRIITFNEQHADPSRGLSAVDVIELKADSVAGLEQALDETPDELFPFFEIPITEDPRGLIATLVGSDAGAKVRTGGVTADLYPKTNDLARFIEACTSADVPFKATAGLHHPLRHYSEAVKTMEFGFLNVFLSACLAARHQLTTEAIVEMLEITDIAEFSIEGESIECRGHSVSAEVVDELRESVAISFGSCSFDEPREDLRVLGLL